MLDGDATETGVWVSLTDLAMERGVTSQAMGKRVRRLEADGEIETRRIGNRRLVNKAEFDLAIEKFGDAVKEGAAVASGDDFETVPGLRAAQARRATYEAEMARLRLEREQRLLLPASEVEAAAGELAEALLKRLNRFPAEAERIAKASGGTDMRAARGEARRMVDDLRKLLVDGLTALAGAEPEKLEKEKDKDHGES